ncbi:amidohydrolase [Naumannella halotolerans]|uniref:Hippurate hydrolase n=1 Tax=Naumannella halotolerans TaxID=993414 RepID=A0A4R7JCW8_9ACTN|nr:amidohydrolase [Naumannella halotolerans]TDT34319.1 hippurate hydrolase [Naumannella halotolerans]
MTLPAAITDTLQDELPSLVETYRWFHQHPELSMQEVNTATRITEILTGYGIDSFRCGGTGVVAVLENGDGPVVAYRADTDGLPIDEGTGLPYASTAEGVLPDGTGTKVMHGCGHDSHITAGLAIARLLRQHPEAWSGTVVMLFQPGEETGAGARAMIADDLWQRVPRPEAVHGQHIWPGRAGQVEVSVGTAMAMADSLRVTVRGKQAHGSQPENSIDPIVLGAAMITRLQTVVSREIPATAMAVLTIGSFHGGLKENIIPEEAWFTISVRSFDPDIRATVLAAIDRIITGEAIVAGAPEPVIETMYDFPRCYNDPELATGLIGSLEDELGAGQVIVRDPVTGSEDFGLFGDSLGVPYVYWFFGGYSAAHLDSGDPVHGNHSPYFGPDAIELSLDTAVRAGMTAILRHLGPQPR